MKMKYWFITNTCLIASMKSFILPAAQTIVCKAFRPVLCRQNYYKSHFVGNVYASSTRAYCSDNEINNLFYEEVSAYLFRQGKTWKRLSHLLEMAAEDEVTSNRSIADVGTDHGLLAMGLTLTGNYTKVIGVDVSDQALTYGAISLLERIKNQSATVDGEGLMEYSNFPIEFRLGDGLEALEFGEADTICIAGMGVNTMLQILEQRSSKNSRGTNLEKIGSKRLVLQATNSRPRNLVLLYDRLQDMGWELKNEQIEKLSSRWYITSRFDASKDSGQHNLVNPELPGSRLTSLDKNCSMRRSFDEYCLHHKRWIQQDAKASGQQIDSRDLRWLKFFFHESF